MSFQLAIHVRIDAGRVADGAASRSPKQAFATAANACVNTPGRAGNRRFIPRSRICSASWQLGPSCGHVLERRLDDLPRAACEAAVLALSPFVAAKDAIDLVDSTNVQSEP